MRRDFKHSFGFKLLITLVIFSMMAFFGNVFLAKPVIVKKTLLQKQKDKNIAPPQASLSTNYFIVEQPIVDSIVSRTFIVKGKAKMPLTEVAILLKDTSGKIIFEENQPVVNFNANAIGEFGKWIVAPADLSKAIVEVRARSDIEKIAQETMQISIQF
ncbi:MAG: hypothetical protein HYW78_04225 [Parcubacteria group bacterium]|nr:hypothetical protein [Parcubacteria group bacterium]